MLMAPRWREGRSWQAPRQPGRQGQGQGQQGEAATKEQGQGTANPTDPSTIGRIQPAQAAVGALMAVEQVQSHRQTRQDIKHKRSGLAQHLPHGRQFGTHRRSGQAQLE